MVHSIPFARVARTPRRVRTLATALLAVTAMGVDVAYIATSSQPVLSSAPTTIGQAPVAIDATGGPGLTAATVARQGVVGGGVVTRVSQNAGAAAGYQVTIVSQQTRYTVSLSAGFGVLAVRERHGI